MLHREATALAQREFKPEFGRRLTDADPSSVTFLAIRSFDASFLGYAFTFSREVCYDMEEPRTEIHLDSMAVIPECRGHGVGAAIIRQLINDCDEAYRAALDVSAFVLEGAHEL